MNFRGAPELNLTEELSMKIPAIRFASDNAVPQFVRRNAEKVKSLEQTVVGIRISISRIELAVETSGYQ